MKREALVKGGKLIMALQTILLILLAAAIVEEVAAAEAKKEKTVAAQDGELGVMAKELQIAKWIKGGPVTLKDGRGNKIHVVEFWATWCPPCRRSVPHLTGIQKRFKDKGVVVIGISNEEPKKVEAFVNKMGDKMDYVVAIDKDRATSQYYMQAFKQGGIPHAFIVDKAGRIAWHGHPMVGLDEALEEMAAGKYSIDEFKKKEAKRKLLNELEREYWTAITEDKRGAETDQLGEKLLKMAADNAELLNNLAWRILTHDAVKYRNLDFAKKVAKAAYDACEGKTGYIVDTYARALFDTGQRKEAVKYQEKAVNLARTDKEREQLKATLNEYRSKVGGAAKE